MKYEYDPGLIGEFTHVGCGSCKVQGLPTAFPVDRHMKCRDSWVTLFGPRMARMIYWYGQQNGEDVVCRDEGALPTLFSLLTLRSEFPVAFTDAKSWIDSCRYDPALAECGTNTMKLVCVVCHHEEWVSGFHTGSCPECSGKAMRIFGPRFARQIVACSLEAGDKYVLCRPTDCGPRFPFGHAELKSMFLAACTAAETYLSYEEPKEGDRQRLSDAILQERVRVKLEEVAQCGSVESLPRTWQANLSHPPRKQPARQLAVKDKGSFVPSLVRRQPVPPPGASVPPVPAPIPMNVDVPWVAPEKKPPGSVYEKLLDSMQPYLQSRSPRSQRRG